MDSTTDVIDVIARRLVDNYVLHKNYSNIKHELDKSSDKIDILKKMINIFTSKMYREFCNNFIKEILKEDKQTIMSCAYLCSYNDLFDICDCLIERTDLNKILDDIEVLKSVIKKHQITDKIINELIIHITSSNKISNNHLILIKALLKLLEINTSKNHIAKFIIEKILYQFLLGFNLENEVLHEIIFIILEIIDIYVHDYITSLSFSQLKGIKKTFNDAFCTSRMMKFKNQFNDEVYTSYMIQFKKQLNIGPNINNGGDNECNELFNYGVNDYSIEKIKLSIVLMKLFKVSYNKTSKSKIEYSAKYKSFRTEVILFSNDYYFYNKLEHDFLTKEDKEKLVKLEKIQITNLTNIIQPISTIFNEKGIISIISKYIGQSEKLTQFD